MSLIQRILKKSKWSKVLVLSWWGLRGFYSIGILKWLEELNMDKDIDYIFWVSIGAIIGSLWASGLKSDAIYKIGQSLSVEKFYGTDMFKKTGGILSNQKILSILQKNLPSDFSQLQKKLYVGTVDTNKAKYLLIDQWDLPSAVLWSMSIPWIFPPVVYKDYSLVDGWVLNNFPVDLAREMFPKKKIIGIALNKFEEDQKINSAVDSLMLTFEIMLRSKLLDNTHYVDYLFYRKIPLSTLSLDKKKMKEAYEMGYVDCLKMFKK